MLPDSIRASASLWETVLHKARRHKHTVYGKDAEDNARFYGQSQDFMYSAQYNAEEGIPVSRVGPGGYFKGARHRMSNNLVFNMVEAYMPALYAKNPTRKVNPKHVEIPDQLLQWLQLAQQQAQMQAQLQQMPPQMQQVAAQQMQAQMQPPPLPTHDISIDSPQARPPQPQEVESQLRAKLVEWALNQLVVLNDLKTHSRAGILDGLVHGRGVVEVAVRETNGYMVPGSFHVSDKDLLVDPDVLRTSEAKWIAIRRRKPVFEVEQEWGYPEGTLRGNYTSFHQDAQTTVAHADPYDHKQQGGTCDLIEYFDVYSRIGIGAHLQGAAQEYVDLLDSFGPNALLIIAPGHDFPLNLPKFLFEEGEKALSPEELLQEIEARIEWPIPTWKRPTGNPWPVSILDFHLNPDESWPVAHTTPAMPLVKSINWVFSYMMNRVRIASRVFPVVDASMSEDNKDGILHDDDLTLLERQKIPGERETPFCEFLTIPDVSKDLWMLASLMKKEFEDSTGVSELMLTGQTDQQMRSAAEANVKQNAMSVRPADMANTVQDWMSDAAANEAFALLHCMDLKSIAQLFGEQYVDGGDTDPLTNEETPPQMGQYTQLWQQLCGQEDASEVLNYLQFDIESGSAQKKNAEQQQALGQQSMQMLFGPLFQYYAKTGDPSQLNGVIRTWAMANEFPDPDMLMFPDMRQQIAAQQQQAQMQQQQEMQMKMQQAQAKHQPPQAQQQQKPQPPVPPHPAVGAAMANHFFPV